MCGSCCEISRLSSEGRLKDKVIEAVRRLFTERKNVMCVHRKEKEWLDDVTAGIASALVNLDSASGRQDRG